MPEKKKSKKSKGLSKKKKALLAEMQRLAEEAHIAEEQELKKSKERERKALEEERKRLEEERRLKEEEQQRLKEQAGADVHEVQTRSTNLLFLGEGIKSEVEWQQFLECNPLPNVYKESELTTYRSMWEQDIEADCDQLGGAHGINEHEMDIKTWTQPLERLKPTMEGCYRTEAVISLLSSIMGQARENNSVDKQRWHTEYTVQLRDVSMKKLDQLTTRFIQLADEYEDSDKKLAMFSQYTPDIRYGLWVHTSAKRGRIKSIDFKEIKVQIELPLALQTQRNAIRVIHTTFDHVSNQLARNRVQKLLRSREQTDEHKTGLAIGWEIDQSEKISEEKERERIPLGKDSKVRFVSVGGVVDIQQLQLPPASKKAKAWIMREITQLADKLHVIPYPNTTDNSGTSGAPLRITHTPLRITYTIPKFVLLRHRDPVFGWWDEARGQWQREGASCLNYDPELRQVELSLSCLKPFAIIQPRALDYPYREWSLTTLSTNSCLIKVRGSRFQIAFEVTAGAPGVPMQPGMPGGRYNSYGDRDNSSGQSEYQKKAYFKGGYVRLVEPNFPQLAHIFNKPMGPGELLMALSHSGINLLPADEDAIFSRKPLKTGILEQELNEQVAMAVGLFDMCGSPWNSSRGGDKILFQVRQSATNPRTFEEEKKERMEEEKKVLQQAERAARKKEYLQRRAAGLLKDEDEDEFKDVMDDDDYGYDSDSAYQESGRRFRRGRNSDGELSDEDDNSDDGYGYGRRSGSQKGGRKSGSRGNTGDDDSRAGQGIGLNDTLNIGNYQQLIDSNNNDWVNVLGEEKKYKMVQTTAFAVSEEEFPGAISHFNFRRALAAHFGKLEFDNEVDDLQAHRDRVQVEVKKMWPLVDEATLSLQQNVKKMLNLLRVFTFY